MSFRDVFPELRAMWFAEFRLSIRRYHALGNRRWVAIVLTDYGRMLHAAGHPGIARRMWEELEAALTKQ